MSNLTERPCMSSGSTEPAKLMQARFGDTSNQGPKLLLILKGQ
jgi:hypothetical protein